MGSSNFRNTIGVFKDQTSITLAKVSSFSDLRIAIVKTTDHKMCPAKEHHIRKIITLVSYSVNHAVSCVATISQRLCKTKDWVVAIKALILIQRLMQEGSPAFAEEVLVTTNYNGTHMLDMSNFRDATWANSWNYSAFVRAYALYLREQLNSRVQEREETYGMFSYIDDENEHLSPGTIVTTTPVWEMHNNQIYSRIERLIKQLDSFLACRPTGAAQDNRIITLALYPLVKQSFQLYYEITESISILQDRFDELDVEDSMNFFEILCKVAKQYEELDSFYHWCSDACIATTSDYPEIKKISQVKLDEMNELVIQKIEITQLDLIHEPQLKLQLEPEPELELKPEPEPELELELVSGPEPELELELELEPRCEAQDIGDLLCIEYDAPTTQSSDHLALALFGNGVVAAASETTRNETWEAFNESSDWETALVQTASQLSNQQPSLPGGFDALLLDEMYQQGATQAAINSGMMTTGSASSVASGSSGMLALLPGPGEDPFAASNAVPPPLYVQMSDIEKKQRLLSEEQMMWQQYQGQVGMANMYMKQSVYI
ncbi:hypothetical protein QVD17_26768 [Tagetes erecta]|uniref:ENTH domain-containing protein n=1 Tax=Tagetes erecta TaxID=13708 RepID=A0AAD8K9M9_TARER|nr:hypothetical protein QVD17_26768 [Tagetes erecta]